jgi:hypothetical protein
MTTFAKQHKKLLHTPMRLSRRKRIDCIALHKHIEACTISLSLADSAKIEKINRVRPNYPVKPTANFFFTLLSNLVLY